MKKKTKKNILWEPPMIVFGAIFVEIKMWSLGAAIDSSGKTILRLRRMTFWVYIEKMMYEFWVYV